MAKFLFAAITVLVIGGLIAALAFSQTRTPAARISGFIEADEIRVGSRIGGRVAAVVAEEGSQVQAGTVLVHLQPFDLLARKAQAQAERDAAASELARMTAGLRVEEIEQKRAHRDQLAARLAEFEAGARPEDIAAAKARVSQGRARVGLARSNYNRSKTLAETGRVSEAELERSTETLQDRTAGLEVAEQEVALLLAGTRVEVIRAAKAAVEQAEAALALAKQGYRKEDIAQSRAVLAAREAALAAIEIQVAELTIVAPVDGTVEAIDLQPGDLVNANAPVLSLVDTRKLWVRAYLPENHLGFRNGHPVDVTVDSFPGLVFHGTITFISRQAEFTPRNVQTPEERAKQVFRIKVTLTDGHDRLRPGMAADVWLEGAPED